MKQILILIIFIASIAKVNAQNIIDFFYSVPTEYIDNLSYIERKKLIKNGDLTIDDRYYSIEIDKRNGYLRLNQSYTEGQSGYGIFEISYWNLPNKKLIALSSIGGSNGGFSQNNFKFFEYEKDKLTEINTGYLKSYSSNFDVFMNNLVSEFTKSNISQKIKDELVTAQFTIELPKNGKDIHISFKENYMSSPDYFEKKYAKYIKIKDKKYIWNIKKQLFE